MALYAFIIMSSYSNLSFISGITSSILLPFVAFMVTDLFGYPVSSVGYYGGWLTSAYFMAQIFSSIIMGQLSDIKGRRIIMLIGMTGNLFTTLIFGLSRVFWLAILSRLVCGFINGNTGVVKTYIREITDETNQARGHTLRSAGYYIGAIVGPILGGVLARPAVQYPGVFSSTGTWAYFPFLLPCLASAAITAVSLILAFLYLQETVKLRSYDEDEGRSEEMMPSVPSPSDNAVIGLEVQASVSLQLSVGDQDEKSPLDAGSSVKLDDHESAGISAESNDSAMVALDLDSQSTPRLPHSRSRMTEIRLFWNQLKSRLYLFGEALQQRDVIVSIILYSGVSFIVLGYDEVFAFWAILPPSSGGVSFTTLQVGTTHAISGVAAILMQLVGYVPLDKAIGSRNSLTIATASIAPIYALAPLANHWATQKASLWAYISFITIFKAASGTVAFAAVNLLVSNAASSQTSAAVNGMSASTASVARMFAPVLMGSIFAATSNASVGWPIDYNFVFYFLGIICLAIAAGSNWGLPMSIDKRKA